MGNILRRASTAIFTQLHSSWWILTSACKKMPFIFLVSYSTTCCIHIMIIVFYNKVTIQVDLLQLPAETVVMPELSAAVQKLEVVDFHQCQTADVGAIHAPISDPPTKLANSLLLVQKTSQLEAGKQLDHNDNTLDFCSHTIMSYVISKILVYFTC